MYPDESQAHKPATRYMYSVCHTSHPATTVEHSIQCNFYHPGETNLVVAGANQIQVYRIHQEPDEIKLEDKDAALKQRYTLELLQSFELYGTVASLQKVTLGRRAGLKIDSLVLSFHDAKLSIVEYNPETHDLKTISMHFFEDETLRDGCVTNHMFAPLVRVDPENRCIAMLIYGKQIVIIPLDKDEEEDLDQDLYNTSSSSSSAGSDDETPMDTSDLQVIQPPVKGPVVTLKPALVSNFKSPVLPSYRIDLSEDICGEKIDNIVDIHFLHNYNDPTLVILHEPNRTWSGRVAMRQDTFSMVALSMNLQQRLQPIIWTVNNLPYDSQRILPVPKPIGGLLVIACNELIYLNQSVPAFGMSFNLFTKDSSTFAFNDQEESAEKADYINISLDLSQAVFLNHNKILFILKDGDVYLVTLFNDDMRSIKNFNFERIGSTVQPNCLTLCENNLLFIGSHVGDSVLAEIVGDLGFEEEEFFDPEEADPSITTNGKPEPVFLYDKHDQLMSTSASGRICYGEAPNNSESIRPYDYKDPHIEFITTAGHHKNGSVCVFQKTVRPIIDDTYELPKPTETDPQEYGAIWFMKPSKQSDPANSRLLLNRESLVPATKVFSTKGQLSQLEKGYCPLAIKEPTIFAANIGQDDMTLQVMSTGIQLVSDDTLVYRIELEDKICDACFADPHIIVLTRSGSIYHVQIHPDPNTSGPSLVYQDIGPLTNGRVISMTIYKDVSGLFQCKQQRDKLDAASYPTDWLSIVNDRGVLEIFSVPDFNRVYSVDNFPSAPNVLTDNIKLFVTDLDSTIVKTKEILMVGLGRQNRRPLLFARSESELVVYEAYRFVDSGISNNHLQIRFKKIYTLLLNAIRNTVSDVNSQLLNSHQQDHLAITDGTANGRVVNYKGVRQLDRGEQVFVNRRWLHEFRAIEGYDGVFLSGYRPHWFIMTALGALRSHPMTAEGQIMAFCKYDTNKFIYITEKRELKIARLPSQTSLNLGTQWPMRKINMGETVHFVNYHVERKVYCVVTSSPSACLKIMKVGSEPDTMKIEDLERENGYIPPTIEKFRLRLYDPENWELIPGSEEEFEEWEQVTCVKNVLLASEGTTSGLKGYIAISTNYCYGEDVPNRGRIWILDLIEVVPEPDQPLTKNKIKKVYCQEQKGPVTTLSHTCGLLMSAVGQKIYLWQLKEEQLDGVAFIDTQIYIHCASSVKNLILVSDVCKSVSLLRYQQKTRTLSMVCRDSKPLEVFACDFVVNNDLLNFVVTDSEKNLIIYAHDPTHPESCGGIRLLRRADFHLGAHVTGFCRLRGKVPSSYARDQNRNFDCRRRHLTMFCTVDGAIGYVYPISESVYQQFQMLQNEMTIALPHTAGLNPKAWRLVKQARPGITNPCRLIIDGNLINRFLLLSARERNELTRKIGTTTEQLLSEIQAIQESTL